MGKTKKQRVLEKEPVWAQSLARKLEVQQDIMSGTFQMTALGRNQLYIENYTSILLCTPSEVKVSTRYGKIMVRGEELNLAYYRDDSMCIMGEIKEMEYI